MANHGTIILLDDELDLVQSMEKYLQTKGYTVYSFDDGNEALAHIKAKKAADVVVSDIRMPAMDGMEFLNKLQQLPVSPPVIMMTAYGSIQNAVDAMKTGAYDYLTKPFDVDEMLIVIQRAMELVSLRNEVRRLRNEMERRFSIHGLAAKSKGMQNVLSTVARMSSEKTPVLFVGDSGTGKQFLAQVIHQSGDRSDKPFEMFSCSAVREGMQSVQIFGDDQHESLLQKAEGGILFLDDLDALEQESQLKLLHLLESSLYMPGNTATPIKADVRIIAAVMGKPEDAVEKGLLRHDLFFKLSPYMIQLPELKNRREDIPALAHSFLENVCAANDVSEKKITSEVMKVLLNYSWPGNVRELQNVIERAVILSTTEEIIADDLPPQMTRLSQIDPAQLPSNFTLEELEKAYIYQVLQENNNHQGKTAKALGIDRKTLYRKIRTYYPDDVNK